MKYRHVFLIWLLADIFLAAALLVLAVLSFITGSEKEFDLLFLLVAAYGFVISLPSLIILTVFYFVYNGRKKAGSSYVKPYKMVIICINVLYFLCTVLTGTFDMEFNLFYLCSTAAGLLSFYVVNRKIKKQLLVQTAG